MGTTIPATPTPNATGTETQPAPMVEPVAWQLQHSDGSWSLATYTYQQARKFVENARSYEGIPVVKGIRPLYLHPAPATLADETLRALVEETGSRDAEDMADMARVGHSLLERIASATKTGPLKDWAPMNDPAEIVIDLHNALDDAIARAEAAEAKLAALSQPAPVVEGGTAREAGERYNYTGEQNIAFGPACRANPRREGETVPDYEDRIRGVLGIPVLPAFRATLAPEGPNAEASLREAIEKALRSITYPVSTEIQEGGYDLRPRKDIVYGVDLLFAATATAPAVPDGRMEEVERQPANRDALITILQGLGRFDDAEQIADEMIFELATLSERRT